MGAVNILPWVLIGILAGLGLLWVTLRVAVPVLNWIARELDKRA